MGVQIFSFKRPNEGLSPHYYEMILGQTALCDIAEDQLFDHDNITGVETEQ